MTAIMPINGARAKDLFDAGLLEESKTLYKSLAAQEPEEPSHPYFLAVIHLAQGGEKTATSYLQRALNLAQYDEAGLIRLVETMQVACNPVVDDLLEGVGSYNANAAGFEQLLSQKAQSTNDPHDWYSLAAHLITTTIPKPQIGHGRAEYVRYSLFEALTKGDASLEIASQAVGYSAVLTQFPIGRTDLAELVLDKVRELHPTHYEAWAQTAQTVAASPTGNEEGRQAWIRFCESRAANVYDKILEDYLTQQAPLKNTASVWYTLATHLLQVEAKRPELDHERAEYIRNTLYEALTKKDTASIATELVKDSAILIKAQRTDLAELVLDKVRELCPSHIGAWATTARAVAASPTANEDGRREWIAQCEYRATGRK